jgi:hypothetical protein
VTAPTGAVIAGEEVGADARGYRATLRFAAASFANAHMECGLSMCMG